MNIANGAWGKVVQTSRISAASLTVPASLPPVSADNNIVLTTNAVGQAIAIAASTTYAPGASLPTQLLVGQSSSAAPSATIARGVVAGASNSAAPADTGAASVRAGLAGSVAGIVVAAFVAATLA